MPLEAGWNSRPRFMLAHTPQMKYVAGLLPRMSYSVAWAARVVSKMSSRAAAKAAVSSSGSAAAFARGMAGEELVHQGIDRLEIELRQPALEGPGLRLRQGLEAAVGLEHLLELVALEEAGGLRGGPGLEGGQVLGHSGASLSWKYDDPC